MITLSRLEGFYRVGRTGGYARAAAEFSYPISQPGVHQQVRRLEEELGVRLFERVARDRVALTDAGRLLYEQVAAFLEELPATIERMRAGDFGGTLRLSSSRLLITHLVAPRVGAWVGDHTDRQVALLSAQDDPLGPLRAFETDLVVETLPQPPTDLQTRQVAVIRAFFALPPGIDPTAPLPEAIASLPLVSYPPGSFEQQQQRRALDLLGLSPRVAAFADDVEGVLSVVASGAGYSLVPRVDQAKRPPNDTGAVRFVPLDHPEAVFPVYAVWRSSSAHNPLVKDMVALLGTGDKQTG